MKNALRVTVTSVAEKLFDDEAVSLTLPGAEGVFEILAHHEPMVSTLKPGVLSLVLHSGETKTIPVSGGVVEVSNNRATVLL